MNIELVECTVEYWEFVRVLRNDSRVVRGFVENISITKEQQLRYMVNNSKYYRIALIDGEPAGYFGVIDDDIRICTHPDFQGFGLGKFMIRKCMAIWPTAIAKVKLGNKASNCLFISCGFEIVQIDEKFTYYKLKR